MSTTAPIVSSKNFIVRAWQKLAPQIWTFLASGALTGVVMTGLTYVPTLHIPATLIALVAGAVATAAAAIKSDIALGENAKQITGKLAALAVSSITVTGIVEVATAAHITLPSWLPAAAVIVIPLVAGYFKSDVVSSTPPHAKS
jgi:hypothetical protein